MNIIKLTTELKNKLYSYGFVIHPDLVSDLVDVLRNSGNEKAFLSMFFKNLDFLKEYGIYAHIQSTKQFEKLKNSSNIFSMHIQRKGFNIRILYSFLPDNTILLHGFYEREGKRNTDYSKPIILAEERLKEYNDSLGGRSNE